MSRPLLWKLCLIIVTGVVALFYLINLLSSRTEEGMSLLADEHRHELVSWGKRAEQLFISGDKKDLENWLTQLQERETTWATIARYDVQRIAGSPDHEEYYMGFNLGRSVDWKIHLYFENNPVMEIPFSKDNVSFLVVLPDRMRPGTYWQTSKFALQIVLPMLLLAFIAFGLYRHIMQPLRKLEMATREFSRGKFDVRVRKLLGSRNDELSELANTFDQMASRIGELIVNQRQLIADLSHELRTPLTRLDIAVDALVDQKYCQHNDNDKSHEENLQRVEQESRHIRSLVEDTLTLAWLENERPQIEEETLDLVDLIDVIVDDAKYEFPNRELFSELPNTAIMNKSNHRAVGQALENIIRNALRYTPVGKSVTVRLSQVGDINKVEVMDDGPGVPEKLLKTIFQPFFRVDKSRSGNSNSFGLGLSLAHRQLAVVGGDVSACNREHGGLCMTVNLPKN